VSGFLRTKGICDAGSDAGSFVRAQNCAILLRVFIIERVKLSVPASTLEHKTMPAYDHYKPLRNYMSQFPVMESLGVMRAYFQHLQFNQPMPEFIETSRAFQLGRKRIEKGVVEWELDILTKELILNGGITGRYHLTEWNKLAKAVNLIKDLENTLYGEFREIMQPNILLDMYRMAHRQFPWQRAPDDRVLLRYFKIFGHPDFAPMLEATMHTTASELYTFGLALAGNYMNTFGFNSTGRIDIPNVRQSSWESFKNTFSSTLSQLKQELAAAQSYDQDYAYKVNPLRYKPLIRLELNGQEIVAAPIPTFLYHAFTDGIYYRLVNERGFSDAIGTSYAEYVGEVLNVSNVRQGYTVLPEEEYYIGKGRHDTVDWIVSDPSGDLFIECKAKRLRQESRVRIASRESLDSDLDKMSDAVVQVYETMNDALNGAYPNWHNRGLPIYPLIVTLEEWYLYGMYGDNIVPAIDKKAREKLTALNIDLALLDQHPYSICSVEDLELAIQIMERRSINEVMNERCRGDCKDWMFFGMLQTKFRDEFPFLRATLFPEEWARVNPLITR
jgi:hypothetical protein